MPHQTSIQKAEPCGFYVILVVVKFCIKSIWETIEHSTRPAAGSINIKAGLCSRIHISLLVVLWESGTYPKQNTPNWCQTNYWRVLSHKHQLFYLYFWARLKSVAAAAAGGRRRIDSWWVFAQESVVSIKRNDRCIDEHVPLITICSCKLCFAFNYLCVTSTSVSRSAHESNTRVIAAPYLYLSCVLLCCCCFGGDGGCCTKYSFCCGDVTLLMRSPPSLGQKQITITWMLMVMMIGYGYSRGESM